MGTKFEEEAKAEFSKKMTVDQEEKLNEETYEAIKKKFQGMQKRFEMIGKMGDEKIEELKKKKPNAKVHSFVQISHKKNQTIEEEDKEGNMEKMRGAVSEILKNLTNFEMEAENKFQEQNMAIDQEEKIMKYLGKNLGKIEKGARHLHSEFEHMAKSGKEDPEDIKVIAEQFHEVQEKFELIFQMGDDKMKEIQERRRKNSGKNETRHERPHKRERRQENEKNETRHERPHKRERRPENEKNETRPERQERPGKFDHRKGKED